MAGAIIGAAMGGWLNDRLGRKMSILIADFLFFVGAIIIEIAPAPWVIILGRIFVGFGVGMASMTSPLYISEASPARIRGALNEWSAHYGWPVLLLPYQPCLHKGVILILIKNIFVVKPEKMSLH